MSNSFHFYPYSKIKLSIIRCRSEMIAYIFVILIVTDFQRPTYHWVKSAISERSFFRRVVWQHLHPTPACRWWMSVHTTFFMVAILLSAGEAFHRLAIWVAPKKYFLKDQGADYRVVSPQINHYYLTVHFTSKFSMKILIQRVVLKNILQGAHRQGTMPRDRHQEPVHDSWVQKGEAGFWGKTMSHILLFSESYLTVLLIKKQNKKILRFLKQPQFNSTCSFFQLPKVI